jgi:ABC-type amino acid transport system permease subunit
LLVGEKPAAAGGEQPRLFRPELLRQVWPTLLWGAGQTLRLTLLALLIGTPLGLLAALGRDR